MKLTFEEFKTFSKIVRDKIGKDCEAVVNGQDYDPLLIAKKIDTVVYQYTGNERLICDTEDDYKKINFVENVIKNFNRDYEELNYQINEIKVKVNQGKKVKRSMFLHLLPTITQGDISSSDVLIACFTSFLMTFIMNVDAKAFSNMSMANPPEDSVEDTAD